MAANHSYLKMYRVFRSYINYDDILPAAISKLSSEVTFASVKSCLMFGPGEGDREIQFVKGCATNISKLIAVEPDHESAERLRARLANNLPDVNSQVFETTIQNWKGLNDQDQVDLVLMMHVLYYLSREEREELSRNLYEQWLARGGRIVVVSSSRTKCPGSHDIWERLGTSMTAWEDIEFDILKAGFTLQYASEMQLMLDMSNLDESFLSFFKRHTHESVTLDDIHNVIKELFPEGKTDQAFYMLAVFQKA